MLLQTWCIIGRVTSFHLPSDKCCVLIENPGRNYASEEEMEQNLQQDSMEPTAQRQSSKVTMCVSQVSNKWN